jgi:hypothetical protein
METSRSEPAESSEIQFNSLCMGKTHSRAIINLLLSFIRVARDEKLQQWADWKVAKRWMGNNWRKKKGSKEEEARETLSPLFSVFLALLSAFLGWSLG